MVKKEFKIHINAPRVTVWHVLWNDFTYRQWTRPFKEGSYAVSDWNQGSEIQFLTTDGNGMYSVIDKKEEPLAIAFKHLGEIKNKVIQPEGDWAGALESYTLIENGNTTELIVEIDMNEEWREYFEGTFPKAFQLVKEIAESDEMKTITVTTLVNTPVEKVWEHWTEPEHIKQWNNASPDWHTPKAENDLRIGGKFTYTMAAKDGSFSFDFWGVYDEIKTNTIIKSTLGDNRKLVVKFEMDGTKTKVIETFEPEHENPIEMQRMGWQAILDNFKRHTETN